MARPRRFFHGPRDHSPQGQIARRTAVAVHRWDDKPCEWPLRLRKGPFSDPGVMNRFSEDFSNPQIVAMRLRG